MSRRDRVRHSEDAPAVPETAPEAVANTEPAPPVEPASLPETAPEAKPMRPGLVRVRALQSVTVGGMAYQAGDVFVAHESKVAPRIARGEVEPA